MHLINPNNRMLNDMMKVLWGKNVCYVIITFSEFIISKFQLIYFHSTLSTQYLIALNWIC